MDVTVDIDRFDPRLTAALAGAQELGLIADVGVAAWVADISVEAIAQMSPLGAQQLIAFSKNPDSASAHELDDSLSAEARSRMESMDQVERGSSLLRLLEMWRTAQVDRILQRELARSGKRNSLLSLMVTIYRTGLQAAARTARLASTLVKFATLRPPPSVIALPWLSPKTSSLGIASPPRLLPGRVLAEAL